MNIANYVPESITSKSADTYDTNLKLIRDVVENQVITWFETPGLSVNPEDFKKVLFKIREKEGRVSKNIKIHKKKSKRVSVFGIADIPINMIPSFMLFEQLVQSDKPPSELIAWGTGFIQS
jgi:hypothetical protein